MSATLRAAARAFYNATIGDEGIAIRAYSDESRDNITALGETLRAALEGEHEPAPWGFVIVHADGKRWRTMDSLGMPEWTDDIDKALCVSLRDHADAYAADDPEDVRIRPRQPAATGSTA